MSSDARIDRAAQPRGPMTKNGSIATFVHDPELFELVSRCLNELPGVIKTGAPGIEPGDIEDAIAYLTRDPSPSVVLVDLTGVAEPLVALDRLADVCHSDTRVIALGDINDIHFYHNLIIAGVTEYFVKPVSEEQLRTALRSPPDAAAKSTSAAPVAGQRPIVVVGARGGVGATMVAVSLAWYSAEKDHQRTVLVDLDLSAGTVGMALDVEAGRGLADALATPERIDGLLVASATVKCSNHLFLLSSELALENRRTLADNAVPLLVAGLQQNFQRIVFDVPRSEPGLLAQGFEQAAFIVIVTDFSLAGMRDTLRLLKLAKKLAPGAKCLVVGNRFGVAKKGGVTVEACEKTLATKLAAVIREDPIVVPMALGIGKSVPESAPDSDAAAALYSLAVAVDCVAGTPEQGWFERVFSIAKTFVMAKGN